MQPGKAQQLSARWHAALLPLVCALGCGILGPPGNSQYPAVEMPTHFGASSPPAKRPPAAAPSAPAPPTAATAESAPAAKAKDPKTLDGVQPAPAQGYLPDPPPLSERAQWLYTIDYDRGTVLPGSPVAQCFERPVASARRMGRFAFELWVGEELVERVRFDFPLLANEVPRQGTRQPLREVPSFAPGAHVSASVRIPASSRATRAQILDRATGQTSAVTWPPEGSATSNSALCPAATPKTAPPGAPSGGR